MKIPNGSDDDTQLIQDERGGVIVARPTIPPG